jgi:hypothetical protein
MDAIELKTGDRGDLVVPAEVIGSPSPHSRFQIERTVDGWLLRVRQDEPVRSPAERLAAFEQWLRSLPPGPGLPAKAVSRDAIYE